MSMIRVYDLPTRVFHATFSVLFIVAFIIAKTVDDESTIYGLHMLMGLIMLASVLLRIFWGFFGSKYARFNTFQLNPKQFIEYIKNATKGTADKFIGHNPGSSMVAIGMFGLTFLLVISGYNMAIKNYKYIFEEVHEIAAHLFLLFAVAHIVGIILHTIKHKETIAISMITGKKNITDKTNEIDNHSIVAILYIVIIALLSVFLFNHYNRENGNLDLGFKNLQLIKVEKD